MKSGTIRDVISERVCGIPGVWGGRGWYPGGQGQVQKRLWYKHKRCRKGVKRQIRQSFGKQGSVERWTKASSDARKVSLGVLSMAPSVSVGSEGRGEIPGVTAGNYSIFKEL